MRKEVKQLQEIIEGAKNILISTHREPDPDALSSLSILEIAIKKYLKKNNVDSLIYVSAHGSKFPWDILKTAKVSYPNDVTDLSKYDLIIMIDAHEVERCIPNNENLDPNTTLVAIDHHELVEDAVAKLTLNFNEYRSSAAEEVYRLFREMLGAKFAEDKKVVELTQMGIVSDTGRFLFPNTTSQTYQLMSELIEINKLDMEEYTNMLSQIPRGSLAVMGILIRSFVMDKELQMGYMSLSAKDLDDVEATEIDKEEACMIMVNNFLRTIDGVGWGFIISPYRDEPGKWKVSFRANNGSKEVEPIAKQLNGGGHKYAAGANLFADTKEDAIKQVLEAVKKIY